MNTEFMVLAATTINNPTFVSLSSASFSYSSYASSPGGSLYPPSFSSSFRALTSDARIPSLDISAFVRFLAPPPNSKLDENDTTRYHTCR